MTSGTAELMPQNSLAESRKIRDSMPQLLSVFFMILKASNNLLYLSVLTIFLDKAGAGSLPWVYLLVNLLFIAVQFQFMTRIVGREGHWLLSILTWPAATISFVASFFFPIEILPLLIAFLILVMLIDLITNQAFSAMLNHFLNVGESRRILPVIYASGSFGFILSGLLLKFVLDFVGMNGLLFANGIIVVISGIILRRLKPAEDARLAEVDDSETINADAPVDIKPVEETAMQHPLARLLIISSFIIIFNKYLVDFLFAASLTAFFSSGNDLAAFMGVFGAAADFAVIGLQTFVMNRVFSAFPIGRVLAFMPIVLTLLCILASFSLKFAVIATVQFLVLLNSKNFTVPATTILMGIIPQKNRVFYRRDMSIACSISSAVVGIFLLMARERLGYDAIFMVAASLYLLMAIVHVMLDRAYLKSLRRALGSKDDEFAADQISSLRFLQHQDRIQQLKELLSDASPRIRNRAIEETATLPVGMARELLEPLIEYETDSRCLTSITRNLLQISPEQSAQLIQRLLEQTIDDRLRSDIIETIGKIRSNAINEDTISQFLDHKHHRVCASAVITTVRLTRKRQTLEKAMHRLAEMAVNTHEMMRASAAAVMGELGLPLFIPALANLAGEESTVVATNAASALSRMQNSSALAVLENLLFHDNSLVASKAEQLLASAARDSVSRISRLLPGITAEERQKLSAKLRSGRHQDSHELLAAILCVDNLEKRRNLISILEKADGEMLALMNNCISVNGDYQVDLKVAPLLEMAQKNNLQDFPHWASLLTALGSSSIERPDLFAANMAAAEKLITSLWHQKACLILNGACIEATTVWQNHAFVCVRLVACLSSEPATMIKSLKELKVGKSFSRSMAAEFIEARAGHQLAAQIIPVVDSEFLWPDNLHALRELAKTRGINLEEELMTVAMKYLQQFPTIGGFKK